jgi:hypothetical protein
MTAGALDDLVDCDCGRTVVWVWLTGDYRLGF